MAAPSTASTRTFCAAFLFLIAIAISMVEHHAVAAAAPAGMTFTGRRGLQGAAVPKRKNGGDIKHSLQLLPRADVVLRNASLADRLAALAQHDATRIQALNTQINEAINVADRNVNESSQFSSSAKFRVNAGPGIYMMEVTIGTPALTFPLIMDTGSQLVWMQCQPCQACVTQDTPPFVPASSSTFATLPCSSAACQSLPGQCQSDSSCHYTYSYASQASTQGQLGTDTLTLLSTDGTSTAFPGLAFGCGYNNQGEYGGAAGLVGMGQSALSLPSQLGQALGGKKFSYCLVSPTGSSSSSKATTLVMGEAATEGASSMGFTPMLANPAVVAALYYIDVIGFSVNNQRLNIPAGTFSIESNGGGGMILDSGTTYTYVPNAAFVALQQAFDATVKLPRYTGHPYLPLCYTTGGQASTAIPPLSLHMQGLDLALPLENYFIPVDNQGNYCLAMIPTSGGLQIVGNMLHQNYKVLYDLDNSRIGFAHQSCQ
ncbi:hypothetical protein L7F22_049130 [Adiantum nelumboides]|nr:hypothetical protein [Adiantum nelumboides]